MSPTFKLAEVELALARTRFAGHVTHHAATPSTNTLALEAAQLGLAGGVWVADEQTAGRGRGGHAWHSVPGEGLYVSVLVRPRLALTRALWLSLATGLAAQSAIATTTGLKPDIRWPNDLLLAHLNGSARKVGGILVETASDPGAAGQAAMLRYAVIGIGINLNQSSFPKELEPLATSIALETGGSYAREPLLVALLTALDAELLQLEHPHPHAPELLARFAAASTWVSGKRVRIETRDGDPGYTGTTAGLDLDGFLRVASDDGELHTVLSGGVREAR